MWSVLIAASVLWLLVSPSAHAAPSLDCGKAAIIDEHLICSSKYLSDLDLELAREVELKAALIPGLAKDQRRWVSERNKECGLSVATDRETLDRDYATRCLFLAYEDRLAFLRAAKPAQVRLPREPFLPRLTVNNDDKLCQAFAAAEVEASRSENARYSAVDRPWPGANAVWTFSERIKEGTPLARDRFRQQTLAREVDLEGDGRRQVLAMVWTSHSWRGDVHSLVRFPSDADFQAWVDRDNPQDTGNGQSLLAHSAGGKDPFAWDWNVPAVVSLDGKFFLLDDGRVWEQAPAVTLSRIKADGPSEITCVVQRVPEDGPGWERRIGPSVGQLFGLVQAMAGKETCGGTLNAAASLAQQAARTRWQILLRPWATEQSPYKSTERVEAWLEQWAFEGVWNYRTHERFLTVQEKAIKELAAYYRNDFGMSTAIAEAEASRVIHLVVLAHFNFPNGALPTDTNPLIRLLLTGAPAAEVSSLLWENAPGGSVVAEPKEQSEPLLFFALEHVHLTRLLINAGASPSQSNAFGKTALMYAAQFNRPETVKILLDAGAKTDAQTKESFEECGYRVVIGHRTALHYAAADAAPETIRLLVEAGADRSAKDSRGRIPLDYLANNMALNSQQRAEAERSLMPVP